MNVQHHSPAPSGHSGISIVESSIGRAAIAALAFPVGAIVLRESPAIVIPRGRGQHSSNEPRAAPPFSPFAAPMAAVASRHGLPLDFFDGLAALAALPGADDARRLAASLYSPLAVHPRVAWGQQPKQQPEQERKQPTPPQHQHLRQRGSTVSDDAKTNAGGNANAPDADEGSTAGPALSYSRREVGAVAALLLDDAERSRCFPCGPRASFWNGLARERDDPAKAAVMSPLLSSIPVGVRRVCSILHALRVNSHSDDARGVSAVYDVASKFSHACSPNTFWFLDQEDGCAVHVATRAIAAGELLTFSYIGTGFNLVTHTLARRELLLPLNFVCACPRCAAFDSGAETCRSIPCGFAAAADNTDDDDDESAEEVARSINIATCLPSDASMPMTLRYDAATRITAWVVLPTPRDARGTIVPPRVVARALDAERAALTAVLGLYFSGRSPGAAPKFEFRATDGAEAHFGLLMAAADALGGSLAVRWIVAFDVRRRFGREFYVSAVAACGLLRCLIQGGIQHEVRQRQGRMSDLTRFLAFANAGARDPSEGDSKTTSSASAALEPWPRRLLRVVLETHAWFEGNMSGSPQHAKMLLLAAEAIVVLVRLVTTAPAVATEPPDALVVPPLPEGSEAAFAALHAFHIRQCVPKLAPLRAFESEFAPMFLKPSEVFEPSPQWNGLSQRPMTT